MQGDPPTDRNENPLLVPGASAACFAMVLLLLSRGEADLIAVVALVLAAGNLLLINFKYFKLVERHNRLLSLVRLRARLAAQGPKIDQIGG